MPLYFRAIRGPLGQLRTALKETLPATALLNLCFIGKNTLEILCKVQHTAKLMYVMNKLRMPVIRSACPSRPHGNRPGPYTNRGIRHALTLTIAGAKHVVQQLRPGAALDWFQYLLRSMETELASMRPPSPARQGQRPLSTHLQRATSGTTAQQEDLGSHKEPPADAPMTTAGAPPSVEPAGPQANANIADHLATGRAPPSEVLQRAPSGPSADTPMSDGSPAPPADQTPATADPAQN